MTILHFLKVAPCFYRILNLNNVKLRLVFFDGVWTRIASLLYVGQYNYTCTKDKTATSAAASLNFG